MRWPPVFAIFPLVLIAQKPASADIYPCTEQGVLPFAPARAIELGDLVLSAI